MEIVRISSPAVEGILGWIGLPRARAERARRGVASLQSTPLAPCPARSRGPQLGTEKKKKYIKRNTVLLGRALKNNVFFLSTKMNFLAKKVTFLMKKLTFLVKNVTFLTKKVIVLTKKVTFQLTKYFSG